MYSKTIYTIDIVMKTKTPTNALTLIGAKIRATEAAQTFQVHYPASGCASQGESSRDLPHLSDRMQTPRA